MIMIMIMIMINIIIINAEHPTAVVPQHEKQNRSYGRIDIVMLPSNGKSPSEVSKFAHRWGKVHAYMENKAFILAHQTGTALNVVTSSMFSSP